jgi:hypothetical protein
MQQPIFQVPGESTGLCYLRAFSVGLKKLIGRVEYPGVDYTFSRALAPSCKAPRFRNASTWVQFLLFVWMSVPCRAQEARENSGRYLWEQIQRKPWGWS